ncbi:hypothetical protein M2349_001927 [Caldanaerobacter subterraneus subsp. tengcongensis MB4]|uniref:Uncharacterized protein n=2 Tax=Caldanaerobacter subterraneus TaxID=911092 RepID=Q8RCJ2_CALS4|nr:hypothetical protein [Caldanaerobacter subterraneus]AAM23719.1 hypothetical protein TTE0435 [Caldanaerobacter subterraneus subsp. tengcongensis MB4]MCS3916786.1 hypothetical protein [Caldanaerobacter subterraneus subsp. tengcongensis MB4]
MKKFFIILLLSLAFLLIYAFYPRNGTFNNLILSHYSGISFNKVMIIKYQDFDFKVKTIKNPDKIKEILRYFKNFDLKESNERNYANYDYRTNGYSIYFEGEKDYKIYDLAIAISKDNPHVLEIFPDIINRRLFLYVSHNTYEILNVEVNFEYIEELWKLGE